MKITADIAQAEERLAAEQRFLDAAITVHNPIAIAMAEVHIKAWEAELFRLRLIDSGGWPAPKVEIET
ncbi:hypothetical protein [Microbacterium sp. LWH11-1.2]|uniref:hypothetical protein n=1 Tax=Microbacterium sp. LWH11-1.2 TaxID=3135258 RepID=UPI00313A2F6A